MTALSTSIRTFVLLALVLLLAACQPREPEIQHLDGQVFGTFYQISLPGSLGKDELARLREGIEAELEAVDASMSTYRDDSELMGLNRQPVGQWLELSAELMTVLSAAQQVAEASDGAFDITVGALVNLWSFGPEARPSRIPEPDELAARLAQSGHTHLQLDQQQHRARRLSDHFVDLSGIAKGYGVDRVSAWLLAQGQDNHLVNIGGDLVGLGERRPGQPWRIGVELPDSSQTQVARHILPIHDLSVATSGDYRNFFEDDGQRYSHTIDPRSGQPMQHRLASVTVLHPSNMLADAWATALMVVGPEQAQELARQQNLMVLLLSREPDGRWSSWSSPALDEQFDSETLKPLSP